MSETLFNETATLDAKAILDLLRNHYATPDTRPDAGIFLAEVQGPPHHGVERFADALWLPWTHAGGYGHLVGHEIKVSRSDLATELRDPTKADAWLRFCHRWWLVVADAHLIDGFDIPEQWGVMAPPSGRRTRSMTILKLAPKLTPTAGDAGMARFAMAATHRFADQLHQSRYEASSRQREIDNLRRQLSERTDGAQSQSPRGKRIGRIVYEVEKRLSDDHLWTRDDQIDPAVIEAAVDLVTARTLAKNLTFQVDSVRRDLARLIKQATEHYDEAKLAELITRLGAA